MGKPAKTDKLAQWRQRMKNTASRFDSTPVSERPSFIGYPGEFSEFEVQSYLFTELTALGFDVRGEVMSKCSTCIFDLVIFVDRKPVRIIEVKRSRPKGGVKSVNRKIDMTRELQRRRYSEFGLPVDLVVALREAKIYVDHVRKHGLSDPPLSEDVPCFI